jgi:hypothetical protein
MTHDLCIDGPTIRILKKITNIHNLAIHYIKKSCNAMQCLKPDNAYYHAYTTISPAQNPCSVPNTQYRLCTLNVTSELWLTTRHASTMVRTPTTALHSKPNTDLRRPLRC